MRHRVNQKRLMYFGLAGFAAVVIISIYAEYRIGLLPAASSGNPQVFDVKAGDRATAIAGRLQSAGLIRSRNSFVTYINFHGLRPRLKAGRYELAPTWSGGRIAETLASGQALGQSLVIPEGYRLSQIEEAAAKLGISQPDFQAALAAPHQQAFLAGKPAGISLEGYLFPDSYRIDSGSTATQLVDAMLDNFGTRVGPEYVQAFAAEGLSLHQGLTLASIVEREVSNKADRPIVAQIFLKRFKSGQPLGSDVTAEYASQLLGRPFDVNVDSPYNTRRYPGLPPGPICSPGLNSLDAVAHPATTDYLFFLTGSDGKTYFAKTYAEHQQNIAKHLK